jgi:hypothetical protein
MIFNFTFYLTNNIDFWDEQKVGPFRPMPPGYAGFSNCEYVCKMQMCAVSRNREADARCSSDIRMFSKLFKS